ncbi:acyl-CoA synthetase (AMP-forming)/AMP-acid ligase II [Halarchaeum rubridurum]|uniref:Acyl-CoA synthetase (AMP-forming)/AMP-acid ligase II n=1 Tax=Halarchaeum rubridurum TaxID=489911 RepID=A0A830FUX7_9EURY|nr:class I adenylate-forming enzyme family protein [Halarchaeum rubridurum]MBP1954680.1 acyl-CoA synthetase (AMP-forming)/AMP-acid ligase II [Halarchaeum rubridurum]GGM62970.1 long-chain-fatty-acid--CoA ligase [Halarchaeum rubridurum]
MTGDGTRQPSLGELSTIQAENHPGGLAFADDTGTALTWREFEARSTDLAASFADRLCHRDRVAFLCDTGVDTVTAWNGAVKAGAITSFVHTQSSPETVRYTIDHFDPSILVVSETYAAFVDERVVDGLTAEPEIVVLGDAAREHGRSVDDFVAATDDVRPDTYLDEDDIGAVIWTSGTTGDPKGWCHTYRNLRMKARDPSVITNRSKTRMSQTMPSLGGWYKCVVATLLAGSSLVLLTDWGPERWLAAVERHGVTHASMVPTMWREVLNTDVDAYDVDTLETVLCLGEKVEPETLRRIRSTVCESVVNAYASTEVDVSMLENEEFTEDRLGSVGKPSGGTRVRVVEEGGAPDATVPVGDVGEVIVHAPDRPVWAWQRSEVLDEEFTDGWWYSGDLGYKDEDGYLYLEGRKDFMIKSKGVKVFPSPIEGVLNDHPGVEEAAVVGLDDDEYGQKVTAVVRRSDPTVTAADLDEACLESDEIARFERPREYRFVDFEIPKTPSQKLDRQGTAERLDHSD